MNFSLYGQVSAYPFPRETSEVMHTFYPPMEGKSRHILVSFEVKQESSTVPKYRSLTDISPYSD